MHPVENGEITIGYVEYDRLWLGNARMSAGDWTILSIMEQHANIVP